MSLLSDYGIEKLIDEMKKKKMKKTVVPQFVACVHMASTKTERKSRSDRNVAAVQGKNHHKNVE
jgi:hypothetical protein